MMWSLIALAVLAVFIAAIASRCTLKVATGPTAGPPPSYDMNAALHYDAAELRFPIREPAMPDGWVSNSGSRASVPGAQPGDVTRVGFLDTNERYIQLSQSDAGRDELVRFTAQSNRRQSGTEQIAGREWTVYDEQGSESIWLTDFGDVRVLITGPASEASFVTLAQAVAQAPVLPH